MARGLKQFSASLANQQAMLHRIRAVLVAAVATFRLLQHLTFGRPRMKQLQAPVALDAQGSGRSVSVGAADTGATERARGGGRVG